MFFFLTILYAFMFAALAVLLDFILQVTAFVALIVFDFKRAEDKRVDCFPCIKRAQSSDGDDKGTNIIFGSHCRLCEIKFSFGVVLYHFRGWSEKTGTFDSIYEGIFISQLIP